MLKEDGIIDRNDKLQLARYEIDEHLNGAEIEILYPYVEPDESRNKMWCQGVVIAVKK